MIDLSGFLIPYPVSITACLAVIIALLVVQRQQTKLDHDIAWLMIMAWSWLGFSYIGGWLGFIDEGSRIAMLRAGVFILAMSTLLHLVQIILKARRTRGNKPKSA